MRRKRLANLISPSDQFSVFAGPAARRIAKRTVSAPYLPTSSSGSTTLPRCFDILRPSAITISWKRQPANGSPSAMKAKGPMSRSALVTIRWSKTKPPESPPATSRSAGSHSCRSGWVNICSARASGGTAAGTQRKSASKWQSSVSVSRFAGAPQSGQATSTKSGRSPSGLPSPVGRMSRGSTTGRSASGTGTGPCSSQWMIGIGVPQERWREIEKSLAR